MPQKKSHSLQFVRDRVALNTGLRNELVTLYETHSGNSFDLDCAIGQLPAGISVSAALQCASQSSTIPGHRTAVFSHPTGRTLIVIPKTTPPDWYPFALCNQIGIDTEFASAWREIPSPDRPLWCYAPAEGLIAKSGWSKTQIDIGLM